MLMILMMDNNDFFTHGQLLKYMLIFISETVKIVGWCHRIHNGTKEKSQPTRVSAVARFLLRKLSLISPVFFLVQADIVSSYETTVLITN